MEQKGGPASDKMNELLCRGRCAKTRVSLGLLGSGYILGGKGTESWQMVTYIKEAGVGVTSARGSFSRGIRARECALRANLMTQAKAPITQSFGMTVLATWGKRIGVGVTSARGSFLPGIRARECALRANLMTQAKADHTNWSLRGPQRNKTYLKETGARRCTKYPFR
jgi:hypothetical protein